MLAKWRQKIYGGRLGAYRVNRAERIWVEFRPVGHDNGDVFFEQYIAIFEELCLVLERWR